MKKGATRASAPDSRGSTRCRSGGRQAQACEQGSEDSPGDGKAKALDRLQSAAAKSEPPKPPRAPRPGACHPFVRKQIAEALPELCKAYLGRAKKGDLSTMKLLWQMAELDKQIQSAGAQGAADKKFVRQTLAKYRSR